MAAPIKTPINGDDISPATRIVAGVLAAGVTLVCALMACLAAMERSVTPVGSWMFAALALSMVIGSHLLPAIVRGSRMAQGVFLVCVLVTFYNHCYFFDSEKRRMGMQRQAQIPASEEVLRYERELSQIVARGLPLVSADLSLAQATAAKAEAALQHCQAKAAGRCTSAAAAVQIAQAKARAIEDERSQSLRAEDLRSKLAAAVADHSAKVAAAAVNAVDASIALILGIQPEAVATLTSILQTLALEVMAVILWTVALPPSVKKSPLQPCCIKQVGPHKRAMPKTEKQLGWARAALLRHRGVQPRDSPLKAAL